MILLCLFRDMAASIEIMQLDFEMENFTSQSVTRRINWNIDYRGQNPASDAEKVVTELTVVQKDIQAIIPLSMVRRSSCLSPRVIKFEKWDCTSVYFKCNLTCQTSRSQQLLPTFFSSLGSWNNFSPFKSPYFTGKKAQTI